MSCYVGNGLVGVSLDEDGIYLARNRSYDRHVPFSILLSFAAEGQTLSPSVTVIDFREAIAYRIFVPQASEVLLLYCGGKYYVKATLQPC